MPDAAGPHSGGDIAGNPGFMASTLLVKFKGYAAQTFDPRSVVRRLAAPQADRTWLYPILLHGLCAWALDNLDRKFVRDNMVRYIGETIARRHSKLIQKWPKPGRSFLALASDSNLALLFFGSLDCFGGIEAIMDACSADEIAQLRKAKIGHARSVVDLMSIVHLYGTTGGKKRHPAKMNVSFAAPLAAALQARRATSKVINHPKGEDAIRKHWDQLSLSCALIYSASLLEYKGTPLFDLLFGQPAKYVPKRINRWLKMSKRISNSVISNWSFQKNKRPHFVVFPKGLKSGKLPPPKLRLCESLWLLGQFQEMPAAWKEVARQVEHHALKPCAMLAAESQSTACAACGRFLGRFDKDLEPEMRQH
jgi:hypothetical protein